MKANLIVLSTSLLTFLVGCETSAPLTEDARGLDSPSAYVRRESANRLRTTRVDEPELRRQLVRRLSVLAQSDPEPLVRSAALLALTRQDPAVALDVAKRVRTDSSPMVRWDAAIVLRKFGDEAVVDVLIEIAAKDAAEEARREAVKALGDYDGPRVIDALIARLDDPEISVKHAARDSLIRISGGAVDFGMNAQAWRKWWTAGKPEKATTEVPEEVPEEVPAKATPKSPS